MLTCGRPGGTCDLTMNNGVVGCSQFLENVKMTTSEQKVLARGVAAGTVMGLALGLSIALFIAMKPGFFAALIQ